MQLEAFLSNINDFLYSYILIALLVLCGLYFTIKTKFVQISLLPDSFKLITEKSTKNSVSSFQALMISTASKVGTGNIAGITVALVAGGPGAIFWMWIMAFLGSASAFIESTLAQIYKVRNNDENSFRGGPSYYIQMALGKRSIGILFSCLLISCFAFGFNALQSYNISSSFQYYIPEYQKSIWPLIVGLALGGLTAFIIFGGVHRIGFISSIIVPIMATIYLSLGVYITLRNIDKLPAMFATIFNSAFDFKSIVGGFSGSVVLIGIKRGLFSNEAGMGSTPNAAASADVSHPVKQGLVQVISVFIDTFLICTTTAFIVLLSGIALDGYSDGIPLVQEALNEQIGIVGIHFMTFSIFAFAFSSIVGNYCYAESNLLFIKNNRYVLNIFRIACVVPVVFGATSSAVIVWNIADICMGLMAIVNIISIIILSNRAIVALNDYVKQKQQNKNPVFNAPKNKIYDSKLWK